jgi:hypothetical protein
MTHTQFEVEWCTAVPDRPDGGSDWDRASYSSRDFQTADKALDFAAWIGPRSLCEVRVREFELVPYDDGGPGASREYLQEIAI